MQLSGIFAKDIQRPIEDVIKTNRIRCAKNGQDFPFGFKLDGRAHGPQQELAVHFISPEYLYSPEEIRIHGSGKDELRVILAPAPGSAGPTGRFAAVRRRHATTAEADHARQDRLGRWRLRGT